MLSYQLSMQIFTLLFIYAQFHFAKHKPTTRNVQKTSFPFGCPYKRESQPLDSIDVCFDPPCSLSSSAIAGLRLLGTGLVSYKITKKNWITKSFGKKVAKKLKVPNRRIFSLHRNFQF